MENDAENCNVDGERQDMDKSDKNLQKDKESHKNKESYNDKLENQDSRIKVSITNHRTEIGGKLIRYTARAGILKVPDAKGKNKSHIFFVSYEKKLRDEKLEDRPITFAFNGGPGASSIWLHFGAMGPKRVKMTDDGRALPPPYDFEDNIYSWLDFTDMVFIDPVGTGYSEHPPDEDPKQFYGVKEDIESVGEFIRLYVTQQRRWLSPKYIVGESYGAMRAAGLSGYLQDNVGMDLSGIVLISSVLDFSTLEFSVGNDLPFVLFLPTYTATAWYHKKLSPRLQENLLATLREVEKWAMNEYIVALAYGNSLSPDTYENIVEKLAEYSGLSKEYIKYSNLRVSESRFMKELLRNEFRTVGRMDSRIKGVDADAVGECPEHDASFIFGPFVSIANEYIRSELRYENDRPYKFLNYDLREKWNWKSINQIGFPSLADTLRSQIHKNKYLQILVACGYYDLSTPYMSSIYTVNQLSLDKSLRENISLTFYESGNMLYYPRDMLRKFRKDAIEFYAKSSAPAYRP